MTNLICLNCSWPWLPERKSRCQFCKSYNSKGERKKNTPVVLERRKGSWYLITPRYQRRTPVSSSKREVSMAFIIIGGLVTTGLTLLYSILQLLAEIILRVIS